YGERLYRTYCESCHGTEQARGNAVHLANPMFLETASDAYLRVAINEGRPGAQADLLLHEGRYVKVADAARAYDEGKRLIIIDARANSDYLRMHIEGAISIPYFD